MFKSKGLLKVVSIIMIVIGAISALSLAVTLPMLSSLKGQTIPGVDVDAVMGVLTPLNIALTVFSVLVIMITGILGLIGKSYKAAFIFGVIYLLYEVIAIIVGIVNGTGFKVTSIVGVLIPVLYLWGLYQCKE